MTGDVNEPSENTPPAPSRKRNLVLAGLLLGVMLTEGVAVVVLVKHFGPKPAAAEAGEGIGGLDPSEGERAADAVEVEVVRFRAQNEKARQLVLYDLAVYVTVSKENADRCKELMGQRHATIEDRLTSVIRAADPEVLSEADRATLRQQFRQELNQVLGDDEMIHSVLIPSMVMLREG